MSHETAPAPLAAGFPAASREDWLRLVARALKGGDFERRLVSRTADGLRIEPLYTRADAIASAANAMPGAAPLTRGTRRETGGAWDVRQFHSGADAKAINAAILEDLAGGATSIALHVATPGGSGLALDGSSLAVALDRVGLEACPIALIAGERAPDAAAALDAIWAERKFAPGHRRGHYNADPLGTLAVMGRLTAPLADAMAAAARLAERAQASPHLTALLADGNAYHCGGAGEAQELAAMLATFLAYLRACEGLGIPPGRAVAKIAVALAADTDLFLTIAKLRAARRLVSQVAEAAGAGAEAAQVHFTAVTAWRMMTKRDPWTNLLRTTMAAAAAAMGGADAITVLPFTYAIGAPDAFARRMARNTQLVLMEESGLGRVIDPAGGSWYVEKLTADLAQEAWRQFQTIEAAGGMAAALAGGVIQAAIAATAAERAKSIASGALELTGVSAFPRLAEDGVKCEPWQRGSPPVSHPAVKVTPLRMRRLAEPFETLRDAADLHLERTGQRPRVALIRLGPPAEHGARATWITNFLASGGIEAIGGEPVTSSPEAGRAFADSGAGIACLCGSDADYGLLGEATVRLLKSAGASCVTLAGRPKEHADALAAAGVDLFVHAGCDAPAVLGRLHAALKVAG